MAASIAILSRSSGTFGMCSNCSRKMDKRSSRVIVSFDTRSRQAASPIIENTPTPVVSSFSLLLSLAIPASSKLYVTILTEVGIAVIGMFPVAVLFGRA